MKVILQGFDAKHTGLIVDLCYFLMNMTGTKFMSIIPEVNIWD